LLLVDSSRAPAAIAGAYVLNRNDPSRDGYDHLEIGVDVARQHRGEGLAPVVVTAMAAEAEALGLLATYYCAPTNIRSQRTAWSCGFIPALSHSVARIRGPN
jgi:RimJ/RimL family protein N-acetyltransferase